MSAPVGTVRFTLLVYWIVALVLAIGKSKVVILDPFSYVATHVIQTKSIGCFGSNRVCRATTVPEVPCYLIHLGPASIFLLFPPTPACIFPRHLGWQTKLIGTIV